MNIAASVILFVAAIKFSKEPASLIRPLLILLSGVFYVLGYCELTRFPISQMMTLSMILVTVLVLILTIMSINKWRRSQTRAEITEMTPLLNC